MVTPQIVSEGAGKLAWNHSTRSRAVGLSGRLVVIQDNTKSLWFLD
jgi:hypothetical protein